MFRFARTPSFRITSSKSPTRKLTHDQLTALKALADQVIGQLELRLKLLEEQNSKLTAERNSQDALLASRAQSNFLATMSHEIRTPMNSIISMTQILLDDSITAAQREKLSIIESCGNALLTLINDILDFSKIEAEKVELESIPFSTTFRFSLLAENISSQEVS